MTRLQSRMSPTGAFSARMLARLATLATLTIAGGLSGSSPAVADETARSEKQATIDVTYGVVVEIERIKLGSEAAKGAAVGGIHRHAAVGAVGVTRPSIEGRTNRGCRRQRDDGFRENVERRATGMPGRS